MDERTDDVEGFEMHQRPLRNDPMLDFEIESLVDPDDPGFDSEFDSNTSDLGDEGTSAFDFDSIKDCGSSLYDTDDSDSSADESDIDEKTDQYLRSMTAQLQTEHLKQPKSTQLVLTTEVFKLIKSYQRHGSAARLSASVMAYLEGGGFATRKGAHDFMEREIDANGNRTGPMTNTTRMVTERVRLRFVPLPKLNESLSQATHERVEPDGIGATGHKRKASASNEDSKDERKRRGGPLSPIRPRTAGKIFPNQPQYEIEDEDAMSIDADMPAGSLAMLQHSRNYNQLLHQPGPQSQPRQPSTSHSQSLSLLDQTQQRLNNFQLQTPPTTPTAPLPPSLPSHANLTCPPHQYSLTTDPETQSLLLGTNPIIPFHPLSELKITICPIFKQSLPDQCLTALGHIIALHSQAAQKQYASLLDKYTFHPTPEHPNPPQPPAALFRLAITSSLHMDLEHIFTPTLEHSMAFTPDTRHLMRDLYENLSPGEVNAVEKVIVARAAAVDEDHVDAWWEERNRRLLPMFALRSWIGEREVEGIRLARLRGEY